ALVVYGTSNADCVAKAAALDAGYPPLYPGYTYSSSLSKYGCWAKNGAMLLPPAIGTYGTAARGLFRGQGLKLLDVSLTKDTKISERLSGQFRFEASMFLTRRNTHQRSTAMPRAGAIPCWVVPEPRPMCKFPTPRSEAARPARSSWDSSCNSKNE